MDMELLWPLLLLPLSVVLLILIKLANQNRPGNNLPPGPWSLPLIGNLHQLGPMPHRSLLTLSQKHGPLMLVHLGSIPTLVVSSSAALNSIFKSHDLAFSGRPIFTVAKKYSFNNSNISFAPYGHIWRQARKLCVLELLSTKRVRSFRSDRDQEVEMLVTAVENQSASSSMINLSEMVFSLSYNVMCRTVFGDKHGGGEGADEGRRGWFHKIMAETQELLVGFCAADFFPRFGGWVDVIMGQRGRVERNFEVVNGFYEKVIEEHLGKEGDGYREDLVDVLLRIHKEAPHGAFLSTMNHVKGIMADMLFAGTDTSSATIIWTMAELMRNPRVMSKLNQELEDAIGTKSKVEEGDLEQLQYLKLVIKESLRLHPPAPLLVPRETIEPCKIEGYDIPAKTRVLINATAVATDPTTWKNPLDFWPERFSEAAMDFNGQDFDYVPFGVGRRSCAGVQFAAAIVELVLANLLHCFEWSLPHGMRAEDVDMGEALGLTVHKREPLRLIAKPKR